MTICGFWSLIILGIGQPFPLVWAVVIPPLLKMKILFILTILFFSSFFNYSYSAETCSEGVDCEESINENIYDLKTSLDDLSTYIGVTSEPVGLLNIDEFVESSSDFIKVFGIFAGLLLFSSAFSIGMYFYKR